MENITNHIDELIGKYLSGEASADERVQVEQWALQHQENQKYLDDLRLIFERTPRVAPQQKFNEDAAWNKVKERLKSGGNVVNLANRKSNIKLYYKIAAGVAILLVAGLTLYRSLDRTVINHLAIKAGTKTVSGVLPDGSNVFLNKNTVLTYGYDTKQEANIVKLQGEAYFKINPRKEKEFIIEVSGIYIRDIGTSFNVKAYPQTHTIEVVVEEGEIMFYSDVNAGIHVKAKSKGVYNTQTKKFYIEQPEENELAYKTREFSFERSSLADVAHDLNTVYDKKLIVPGHLRQCRLTVDFSNEDIDEIANVIAETLGISAIHNDNEILLEGQGCE